MDKAIITFSNNDTLIVYEGEHFAPITTIEVNEGISSSMGTPVELYSHIHDGLIPSLTELFFQGPFFFRVEDASVIYSTSAIVKVQSL
ncbi:hypothetical protein V4V35_18700 [Bacillus infantis]|uniref:hypothetical protein n=1 Tax=Bacillus infantis TaxID=324767 RepID=UPI002FBED61A